MIKNYTKISKELKNKGYSVIENFLPKKKCNLYNNIISKIISKQNLTENKSGFHNTGSSMAYNIQNKNRVFFDLIFHKEILKICELYFSYGAHTKDKYNFQFDNIAGRRLIGKCKNQELHIDSRLCGAEPPISIHFFLYLTDVKEESGPTRLVPKSHIIKRYPKKSDNKKTIKILGKRGKLLICNSSIWHGSSKKTNFDDRTIITLSFNRWFFRQKFAVPYSLSRSINKKMTLKQKFIYGIYNYPPKSEKMRLRMRGNLPKN